jgi:prevent-host-death family protein
VDVPITDLRANLRDWVEQARAGKDVVVTERGVPVARLTAIDSASLIERLEQEGLLTRPAQAQRPSALRHRRVRAQGSVSDLDSELRR